MTTAPDEALPPQPDPQPQIEETPPLTAVPTAPTPAAPTEEEPVAAEALPPEESRPMRVPQRTIPLLATLLLFGLVMFSFAWLTVHRRDPEELPKNPAAARQALQMNYWITHGYFSSGGLLVWKTPTIPLMLYRSCTGGMQLTTFWTEKLYTSITGRGYSWRLAALHDMVMVLFTGIVLGLLGFRVAQRMGVIPLHALAIAVAIEAVFFTFPDNQFVYWEMSARIPWLFWVCVFLLLDERGLDRRTRLVTFAQGVAGFLLVYMEHVAGLGFMVSYFVVSLLLGGKRPPVKRLVLVSIVPLLMACGTYAAQLSWMKWLRPEVPFIGADFHSRTGLDGSIKYYVDHLDIAKRRDLARVNWPKPNNDHLFRWKWLFWAGTAALVVTMIAAMRGRVPAFGMVALLAMLGTYLLDAAVFTQAIVIHPYLFDVMIFTPLMFALFVMAPALIESLTSHRGLAVAAIFFVAVWASMAQLRKYALMYPPTIKKAAVTVPAPILPA